MKRLALAFLAMGSAAIAAPPPPPLPNVAPVAQRYLRALKDRDIKTYGGLLADDFVGADPEQPQLPDRSAWLDETSREFQHPRYSVTPERVFYGSHDVNGRFTQQLVIVERVVNFSFGLVGSPDCCSWHRVETLTLEGEKIAKIERSALYDTELSQTGFRTDIPESDQPHY
tara:strand:+ start:719 stop:1231 length:513 start_codon:yes stop_codon:yes gene_type:complete